jgi:hypothetical protein
MERLNELYCYKTRYEKEKLFVEAKIAVVDDMIADEKAKTVEQVAEENVEETIQQDESY